MLSLNEIKSNAIAFAKDWETASRENAESQSFYNDFFQIFGISRRRVATFETFAKKLDDGTNIKTGRIDVFWKGMLLIEQKSAGGNLEKAKAQALDYTIHMDDAEMPRYILVSDFQQFELYDLETEIADEAVVVFALAELHKHIHHFGFIAGYTKRIYKDQEPVNIQAAELMGLLHDALKENGYTGKDLEQFLIRTLFCLFADDTGIFAKDSFKFYIEENTNTDGSDLGLHLQRIFQALDTHPDNKQNNIAISLESFPYVNGDIFAEKLNIVDFNQNMRDTLLKCCAFDWGQISPAIFGSMFQSATDQKARRILGAHYTSEQNIMKIMKPLFLDELWAEFETVKKHAKKRDAFHKKIADLKFLDPACGCGNFLIIAYRELRLLEIEILRKRYNPDTDQLFEISDLIHVNISQFYGIEYEELPAKIAEVALWLTDHQMNLQLSEVFGEYFARIPLTKFRNIHHGNALRMEWGKIADGKINYILGNPPFVGKKEQNAEQKGDINFIFTGVKGQNMLDYVTAWYMKAAKTIQNSNIKVAFVSTNSITQGEQVAILWQSLLNDYNIKIHFAHRTFQWQNEARGKAAVHCVIIGFANDEPTEQKLLYDYPDIKGEPQERIANNINPYLLDADNILVTKRSKPICDVLPISYGSMALDNGFLLLDESEKDALILQDKHAKKFIRPFLGSYEFINHIPRFCIWLKDVSPHQYNDITEIMKRIKAVREYRLSSNRVTTKHLAETPHLFGEIRQPNHNYLLIPKVSSETRAYIPIAFVDKQSIVNGSALFIENATLYEFGILTSEMHNCWMRYTAGRLKSDYRYSASIVYNNFVWAQNPTTADKEKISALAQAILDARQTHLDEGSTLADLYNPLSMPKNLRNAHHALDRAVDKLYRAAPFKSERERVEYLFSLYHKMGSLL
ncbi:MAG: N-6 DNA methylase [Alphaproteobacteria bacterium]|nr:N-6 DNA methylase [Alphaproteobacteria bacterium]